MSEIDDIFDRCFDNSRKQQEIIKEIDEEIEALRNEIRNKRLQILQNSTREEDN